MPKLTTFLIPFILMSTGVLFCTSNGIARNQDIHQQAQPQSERNCVASQTKSVKIPTTKNSSTTINTKNKHTVNRVTGEEENGKGHIHNMLSGQTCLPPVQPDSPFGLEENEAKINLNPIGLAYLDLGTFYAEKGLIDQAILEFTNAIKINPHHLDSHVKLGTAYGLKGMADKAQSEFKKAIAINLNDAVAKIVFNTLPVDKNSKVKIDEVEARINLGNAYNKEENLEKAKLEYEKVLRLKPEHLIAKKSISEVYYKLGNSYLKEEKYNNAINMFDKALEIKPDFTQIINILEKIHYNLGVNYVKNNELDKAVMAFNRAIERNPNYAKLDKNIFSTIGKGNKIVFGKPTHPGRNHSSKDTKDSTTNDVEKESFHEEEKKDKSLHKEIPHEIGVSEEMILAEKDYAKESEYDQNQVESQNSPLLSQEENKDKLATSNKAPLKTGQLQKTDNSKYAKVEMAIAESKNIPDSGHWDFSYYMIRNYKTKMGFNEAIQKYEVAAKENPYDNNVFLHLANAYYSKALYLDDAIAKREDAPEYNQNFSVQRFYLNDDTGNEKISAVNLTEQTKTLEEYKIVFHNKSGNMYHKKERFGEAIVEYKKLLKVDPDTPKTLYNLAFSSIAYNLDKRKEISKESSTPSIIPNEFVAIAANSPDEPADGNIHASTHIVPEGINNKSTSNNSFFSYITRNHKTKMGFDEAIQKYEEAAKKNPYDNNVFLHLANAYYSKAMYLDDAIAKREDAPECNQNFSVQRFYLNDNTGNKEIYVISLTEQAKTLEEYNIAFHNKLGNMYHEKERFGEAIVEYKNVLKVDPDFPKTLYNLAFSFSKKGSYLGIALKSKNNLNRTLSGF